MAQVVADRAPRAGGQRNPECDAVFSRIVQTAPGPFGAGEA